VLVNDDGALLGTVTAADVIARIGDHGANGRHGGLDVAR
jgi:CBS domain-containing protein